jgi:hypothetical protein
MIKAGALDPVARNAPDAIGVALGKMLDRLPVQIWRAPLGGGNIVILDLTDGFVDYLATLGWLPRGERHASSTLKDALVGFASRGLRMSELNPHLFRP